MIDLSMAIVSYHNAADIARCVETIARYTPASLSWKLYLVDNAGERASFEPICAAYPQVEYVDAGGNVGFGKGHNAVLPSLDSRYHAIVNPDILLTEDAFSKLVAYLDANPEVGMAVPRLVDEAGTLLKVYRRELTVFDMFARMFAKRLFPRRMARVTMDDADYTKPFPVPFAQGSFLVIRTSLFRELGGFDPRYFMYVEDADLCREVNRVSRVMYTPCTQVVHKWEKGSHRSLKLMRIHIASMILYMRKWGWRWF